MTDVLERVKQVTRNAAATAIEKLPSPGDPNAEQGKDCGCGRRKSQLVKNLREGKSLSGIISDLVADIAGKETT